jgi:hypothetical protein
MVHFENNKCFASQMDARRGCTNGFTLMRQTMCIPALSRKIFIPLAMGYTHFNKACQLDERLISRSSFINNK